MKAFLEYVDGKLVDDDFVLEIDYEIRNIKEQESERVSYMTYAMKIQEERDEARAEGQMEGRTEGKVEDIKNLMVFFAQLESEILQQLLNDAIDK